MELDERLQLILLKIKKLKLSYFEQKKQLNELIEKNNQLKVENEALKKTNFEMNKQIEVADIANQLKDGTGSSKELKRKLDNYIKEVDAVIHALKEME